MIVHVPRSLPVSVAAKGAILLDSAPGTEMFTRWRFTVVKINVYLLVF